MPAGRAGDLSLWSGGASKATGTPRSSPIASSAASSSASIRSNVERTGASTAGVPLLSRLIAEPSLSAEARAGLESELEGVGAFLAEESFFFIDDFFAEVGCFGASGVASGVGFAEKDCGGSLSSPSFSPRSTTLAIESTCLSISFCSWSKIDIWGAAFAAEPMLPLRCDWGVGPRGGGGAIAPRAGVAPLACLALRASNAAVSSVEKPTAPPAPTAAGATGGAAAVGGGAAMGGGARTGGGWMPWVAGCPKSDGRGAEPMMGESSAPSIIARRALRAERNPSDLRLPERPEGVGWPSAFSLTSRSSGPPFLACTFGVSAFKPTPCATFATAF